MPARPFKPSDFSAFAEAMKLDPQHQDLKPEEFVVEPGTERYVWEEDGKPILYFRISRELRVDIQFIPNTQKRETITALTSGVEWLQGLAKGAGFKAIVFDSVYQPLIRFCTRRLGFTKYPDLRKVL